jgi:hypothetical protein
MNFLLVVGGSGWLYTSGHLDKEKFVELKKILFPPTQPVVAVASTQPAPTTGPADRLEILLAQASGRPAAEQVDFIRHTFDAQMTELDRRQRELTDLQRQVDLAKEQAVTDRAKISQAQKQVAEQQAEQTRLDSDKGFQDSLQLYTVMPARQVKTIFLTLADDTVMHYLQAMQPRTAAKIVKEYKSPEEIQRIQKVLEKIRQSQPPAPPPPVSAGQQAVVSPP